MNELSRELAEGRVGLAEAELQLAAARRIPFPGAAAQILSGTVGSAAFALMFGGGLAEAAAAALAGCNRQRLPVGLQAAARPLFSS